MHTQDEATRRLRAAVFDYAEERMAMDPPPLDGFKSPEELARLMPKTITEQGIGGMKALSLFENVLAPACLSTDHPGYLAFIPAAPTEAAVLFDLVLSASAVYGGSWVEGSGAVYAENETLRWLAREVGLPEGAGGVFVQGGTIGNLSALVAARHHARATRGVKPSRWKVVCSAEAHSSLRTAARVMDIDLVTVPVDKQGKMTGAALEHALELAGDGVFAVHATAGTTNFGIIDDLATVAPVAKAHGLWLHVDGAYGLAGILSPKRRALYAGVELADSFIVDPHKWLFAPFDACALVYRDPEIGRRAHTQHAEYLDTLTGHDEWNPSDYAINLTRRPRGLPLWFSLATSGVAAYREAIEHTIELAHSVADEIERRPELTLVRRPELSVVVFTRTGWELEDYERWCAELLHEGVGFVVPSSYEGKPVMRFAFLNPRTTFAIVERMLNSMR